MIQITAANREQHAQPIRELFWEYLQWANAKVEENFGAGILATFAREERK